MGQMRLCCTAQAVSGEVYLWLAHQQERSKAEEWAYAIAAAGPYVACAAAVADDASAFID